MSLIIEEEVDFFLYFIFALKQKFKVDFEEIVLSIVKNFKTSLMNECDHLEWGL